MTISSFAGFSLEHAFEDTFKKTWSSMIISDLLCFVLYCFVSLYPVHLMHGFALVSIQIFLECASGGARGVPAACPGLLGAVRARKGRKRRKSSKTLENPSALASPENARKSSVLRADIGPAGASGFEFLGVMRRTTWATCL